ncbi:transcription termination factor 1, mitochondrial-like [Denticeps clupeoides]|uniref:Transcription termination factor 1, mitochondrial n=1 Tax=Denticeps clupeoides TaxID=299321 RepID=A0A8C3ZTT6_9TELE|nr:transcription termination factor 1, mitochondrial-like [Denticeps clupeoides]XP_028820418.1 transcription termination factor 1, mitochondrial-like [Denticeps clupeoides]XP_028820419.1 transcription termination factor 1, mitochondrial-like [Denticeps clupeoides]XP_028824956.1 transcription termination factor 1, mitochondrial-like [Denticeps clupeoides]XP_028824957.1 transcription termination factor 1, mitochondrial-like [Denticeps clupeoides]
MPLLLLKVQGRPIHLGWLVTLRSLPAFFTRLSSDDSLARPENECLLRNLRMLGVDLKMARKRQPGVLRKSVTNEHGLVRFLQDKGASQAMIASIISRFPRSITRTEDHLKERWSLWRSIFQSDSEIISILHRSPESFFRSSDNDNLEMNIVFLSSIGIEAKDLHRLLTTAPRTFSNSVELNRQMVEFLEDVCISLGGAHPNQFAKAIISRNAYILIRSTKRVKANIEFLQVSLKLSDSELLNLLQGHGAEILDLSHENLKRNFSTLQDKLLMLGCGENDTRRLILTYSQVLFVSPARISNKLDCLTKAGIQVKQILHKPKVLDFSVENLRWRLNELSKIDYDFGKSGINILDTSRKRFEAKLEKLSACEE